MDWLPIIIVLGAALLRGVVQYKKVQRKDPVSPRPASSPQQETNLDELMEALGLPGSKARPVPIQPRQQTLPPVAPPVSTAKKQSVERGPVAPLSKSKEVIISKPISIQLEPVEVNLSGVSVDRLSSNVDVKVAPARISNIRKSTDPLHLPGHAIVTHARLIAQQLRDQKTMRRAILLNEILQPPLALRVER